jgi:hypothetical protein
MMHRRGFLAGVFSAFAAPTIVRIESIMPIKVMPVGAFPIIGPYSHLYEELQAITRKAFLPDWMAQIYLGSPSIDYLLTERL